MKTLLAKWIISSSLDSGRPLPRWVLRKIESDQKIARFYHACLLLEEKIGRSERSHAEAEFVPELSATIFSQAQHADSSLQIASKKEVVGKWVLPWAISASILLCVVAFWPSQSHNKAVVLTPDLKGARQTPQQSELESLNASANAGRYVIGQLASCADRLSLAVLENAQGVSVEQPRIILRESKDQLEQAQAIFSSVLMEITHQVEKQASSTE